MKFSGRRRLGATLAMAALAAAMICGNAHAAGLGAQVEDPGPPGVIHRPNPRGLGGVSNAATPGATGATTPILYHGGPVIYTPTFYVVWYGNWNQTNGSDTPGGQQIVRDLLSGLGGSAHYLINQNYNVSGSAYFAAGTNETSDAYSRGTRLRDSDVFSVVNAAITGGRLPYNAAGIYLVLTSSDVTTTSGFCTKYCGWHTYGTTTKGKIRYSFVGNANRCLSSCAAQSVGPNGNAGVDGMASVIMHEIEEAASDPDLNAWYDASGYENADKCAWTFGQAQYRTANGALANVKIGLRDFLIQRNLFHNLSGPSGVGDYCMVTGTQN